MKAIMVMFDSLNRHMLPPYGCDWVHAPNFQRLAQRTATFDTCYVGSMPCLPARREIHTGRYTFLHRSWGPIEPFDDSMPELLKRAGVHTHLVSDHYHYWEEGGANYHSRYSSWDAVRGQEGDPWIPDLRDSLDLPTDSLNFTRGARARQDFINRSHMPNEEDFPQARTFAKGLEFIRTNAECDNWMLQIETFDPHEPYYVPQKYIDMYEDAYDGPHFDWPNYKPVSESPELAEHVRITNAALISMCDEYLGRVLDAMDELDLWEDTLLIVNTDHGFMLAEHDCWAKCWCPMYEEVAHTPLFIWDPRTGIAGQRRRSLVQTIDIAPTLLEFFGLFPGADMQGKPLRQTIVDDTPVRQAALFGLHGAHVNVTDGRYVYMRAPATPDDEPLYQYTHMPAHMNRRFGVDELQDIELAGPFDFTKGCKVMKIHADATLPTVPEARAFENMLFDTQVDPQQQSTIDDPAVEKMMIDHMVDLMKANDAPPEQFTRLGLDS